MTKYVLDIEEVYDFSLIGISCHAKDYRLCWEMNQSLSIDMIRGADYEIDTSRFSFFEYIDDENYIEYFFIANRGNEGFLIPEQKTVDYFMLMRGNVTDSLIDDIICKINSVSLVLTSFNIDPNQLKSKQNLLF